MKISLNWIGRHVDLQGLKPDQIAHELSVRTCEVEGVEEYGKGLEDVVLGKVVECQRHPQADKLSLTRVDLGKDTVSIVCGAPNVTAGQLVAVAPVGSRLPDGTKIRKAKIRGEESHGMILSEVEMGLGEDGEGILVLEGEGKPGSPLLEYLAIRDFLLDIDNKSLTHRPDLWGHYGFAREIAALFQRSLKTLPDPPSLPGGKGFKVSIQDPSGCGRYLALHVSGVQIQPSPTWMQWLLRAVGQRPINNLVDLSNFLMLDLGQPTHPFDEGKIQGKEIVVRRARKGETLRTLDEVDRKCTTEDLVIADAKQPVALAGVMGGEASGIDENTQSIVLESAWFQPTVVRRMAQRHGMRTDASSRFEKHQDPAQALLAVEAFARMIGEVSPGAKVESAVDICGEKESGEPRTKRIPLRVERLSRRLGVSLTGKRVEDLLQPIGFEVATKGGDLEITVPSFRATKDVTIEEDLYEEIGRLHGYEKIPEQDLIAPIQPPPPEDERLLVRQLQDTLAGGFGFSESLHYSFLADGLVGRLGIGNHPYVTLTNPIIQERNRIRRTVAPGFLEHLEDSLRQREEIRLFEVGKGYQPERNQDRGQPGEVHECAGVWAWRQPLKGEEGFLRVKGLMESLLRRFGALPWEENSGKELLREHPFLHSGRLCAFKVGNNILGWCGELDPRFARTLGLDGGVNFFSLDLRSLLENRQPVREFQPISKYPGIAVDVAVAADPESSYRDVRNMVLKAGGKLLADLNHFDTFPMKDGRRSYAFHALLQSQDKTLTDTEEAAFIEKVEKAAKKMGGELRR